MKISRFKSKDDMEHRYRELLLANARGEFAIANKLHNDDWLMIHYMLEVTKNHLMGLLAATLDGSEVHFNEISKDIKRMHLDYIELCREVLTEEIKSKKNH